MKVYILKVFTTKSCAILLHLETHLFLCVATSEHGYVDESGVVYRGIYLNISMEEQPYRIRMTVEAFITTGGKTDSNSKRSSGKLHP